MRQTDERCSQEECRRTRTGKDCCGCFCQEVPRYVLLWRCGDGGGCYGRCFTLIVSCSNEGIYVLRAFCVCCMHVHSRMYLLGIGPVFSGYCHCLSCRKAHAAPLYQTAVTKATTFKLLKVTIAQSSTCLVHSFKACAQGQDCLKSNPKETNFGSIDRRFCKECGRAYCLLLLTSTYND